MRSATKSSQKQCLQYLINCNIGIQTIPEGQYYVLYRFCIPCDREATLMPFAYKAAQLPIDVIAKAYNELPFTCSRCTSKCKFKMCLCCKELYSGKWFKKSLLHYQKRQEKETALYAEAQQKRKAELARIISHVAALGYEAKKIYTAYLDELFDDCKARAFAHSALPK